MLERIIEKKIAAESTVMLALAGGEKPGRELRELVNAALVERRLGKFSGPSFYQFMSGMEDRGLVVHEDKAEVVDGETVNPRWFRLTGGGTRLQVPSRESGQITDLLGGLLPKPGLA